MKYNLSFPVKYLYKNNFFDAEYRRFNTANYCLSRLQAPNAAAAQRMHGGARGTSSASFACGHFALACRGDQRVHILNNRNGARGGKQQKLFRFHEKE